MKDFSTVTVRGMGIRDSGVIQLSREDVRPNVVLDFAQRGTVKIVRMNDALVAAIPIPLHPLT